MDTIHKLKKGRSSFMKLVGIDIAKYRHSVVIIDKETGEALCKPFFFNNDNDGFKTLFDELSRHSKEELLIGMEDTGHYSFNLMIALLDKDYKLAMINPLTTKNLRKASLSSSKNDKLDAILITRALMDKDYYRLIDKEDTKIWEAKELVRFRHNLTARLNQVKNNLQRNIDIVFPEYNELFKNKYTYSYMNILKLYPDAYTIAKTDIRSLRKCIKYTNGLKAEDLKEKAKISIGKHSPSIAFIIRSLISEIELIESQIDEVNKKIEELAITQNSSITSIPGIGIISGTSILAEIGDIHKFNSAASLISYTGVCPYTNESGTYKASQTKITKKGSKYLRRTLYQVILPVIRFNPVFSEYYHLKRKQGKGHLCTLGHCIRKLLRIIYHLETNHLKFNPSLIK